MNDLKSLGLKLEEENQKISNSRLKLQDDWLSELGIRGLNYKKNINCDQEGTFIYLFLEAFPSLPMQQVRALALAGQFFANSLVLSDEIIDRSCIGVDINSILGLQAMQFESYHLLSQIFSHDTAFWTRFRSYLSEYTKAYLQESRFTLGQLPWHEYTKIVAIESIKGKTAVAKTAIAGLVELAQDDTYLKPLEE
jgi:hypothetical protein